jgi:hypothetical protein
MLCHRDSDGGACDEGYLFNSSSIDFPITALENRGLAATLIFGGPYPGCDCTDGFDLSHQCAAEPQDRSPFNKLRETGMPTDQGDYCEKRF